MDNNNLLTHPESNEEFKINTDASKLKLGALIRQGGKLITFYSKTLTDDQKRYTVTEREL